MYFAILIVTIEAIFECAWPYTPTLNTKASQTAPATSAAVPAPIQSPVVRSSVATAAVAVADVARSIGLN